MAKTQIIYYIKYSRYIKLKNPEISCIFYKTLNISINCNKGGVCH